MYIGMYMNMYMYVCIYIGYTYLYLCLYLYTQQSGLGVVETRGVLLLMNILYLRSEKKWPPVYPEPE